MARYSGGRSPVIALSIVERELRVQSRRPYTVWLRVGIGLVAGLAGLTLLLWIESASSAMQGGQQLLHGLGWSALVFGMIEGVRQTADSISHEKREGTLGLLFLTDLRGLDVVLGKLAAHALNLLCALMAAFPILGLAIGAGGVT
ncbi:MAG TPA: ABC transporter permease, partial [Verrucomicrobiota bacterium]|nr:ABC transporter permease [Verrucomicrobiota bacterium]